MSPDLAPNAERFPPLAAAQAERWSGFLRDDAQPFARLVGLEVEEVRQDYARIRLPYRDALRQRSGVVHGGAIATLIDTVVVPAVASGYDDPPSMATVNMVVQYLSALAGQDAVAEGWIQRRGSRTVFCRAEVRSTDATLVATGELVYSVRPAQV